MWLYISETPPDDKGGKDCKPTTEVTTKHTTATKPEPVFNHQTQPAKGSPAGSHEYHSHHTLLLSLSHVYAARYGINTERSILVDSYTLLL